MKKQTLKDLLKRFQKTLFARWIYFFYQIFAGLIRIPIVFLYAKYIEFLLQLKVKKAIRLSKLENRRYIVTTFFGKPKCYSKKMLKEAVKRRKFKKGVSIQDIEKHAYFITK